MGANKNLVDQAYNATSWNVPLNANFDNIDQALGGVQSFNLAAASGTVNVSSSIYAGAYPANTASYIPMSWTLTGTLTANVTLQLPAGVGGSWIVNNQCVMGSFTITVAAASGSTSTTLSSGVQGVYCDGLGHVNLSSITSASGAVLGPGSSTSGDIVTWNNSSGTVLADSNIPASSIIVNTQSLSYRNYLINADGAVDQYHSGSSTTATGYFVDQWGYYASVGSKFTLGQNLNSIGATPVSPYYIGAQVSSSYSVTSTDYFFISQPIEAFRTRNMLFGSSYAKTLSLSFWVRSSLTGTFSGFIRNAADTRSYVFTYTISSSNTWTYISIQIPGDTGGSWVLIGNNQVMNVGFSLGAGSSFSTSSTNSWQSGNYVNATGSVNLVATLGATFYITGVQLENSPTSTLFEIPSSAAAVLECQRYYQVYLSGAAAGSLGIFGNATAASQYFGQSFSYNTPMRQTPTAAFIGSWTGTNATGITLSPTASSASLYGVSNAAGFCQLYAPSNGGFSLSAVM